MNHEEDYKPPLQRVLKLKGLSKKSNNNFSCEHEPLLNTEVSHVILDELCLLLRVVDVLLNNLMEDVLQWDKKDDLNKEQRKAFIERDCRPQYAYVGLVLISGK